MSGFYKASSQKVHGRAGCLAQESPRSRFTMPLALARIPALLLLVAATGMAELGDPKALPPASCAFDFEKDVRAVLETSCVHCHNEEKDKGGLRMETRALALKGGDEHSAVVPGKSA